MKLTSAWLQEWLRRTMLDDKQIESALVQAGIEIEQIDCSKPIDPLVVVCSVNKVVQHPGADRLKLVEVAIGEAHFRVVCGAPNVRAGLKVPFAQIGATLPGGERIARAKLRGEVSEGMLCSAYELGLGSEHSGIFELDAAAVVGTPLAEIFPADTIFDLKTPANRFDTQSVLGLARDVAAIAGADVAALPEPSWKFAQNPVVLDPRAHAGRLAFVKLAVSTKSPTPQWMQARLRAAGMRPVSLLVDITNYVMLDVGQPLHAYDASRLTLPVSVRPALEQEQIITLDGVKRTLSPQDLVVVDAEGPVGIAGVMGGERTEVRQDTSTIWLEAAVLDAPAVRKTAKRLGLRSEASARFERGLPVELPTVGLARAVELLQDLAGAQVLEAVQVGASAGKALTLELSLVQLSKIAGFQIDAQLAQLTLEKLQFSVVHSSKKADWLMVTVPWWRPDVKRPVDLIEEIVRVLGYDKVPARIPVWRPSRLAFDRQRAFRRRVRDLLYGAGLFEVMTYSFVSEDQLAELHMAGQQHLKLKNPLSIEQAYLRSNLLPSHLAVAERNRAYAKDLAFYEISRVFLKREAGQLPDEPLRLAITVVRQTAAYRYGKGLLDALAQTMNVTLAYAAQQRPEFAPNRGADIQLDGEVIGRIGELHPVLVQNHKLVGEAAYIELDLAALLAAGSVRQFTAMSKYPVIRRDISVWLPVAVTWAEVYQALAGLDAEYVDEYEGQGTPAGHRGLTIRLTVGRADATPTEAEADEAVAALLHRLQQRCQAQARD